jgi:protein tyrosine/serine phosphatase
VVGSLALASAAAAQQTDGARSAAVDLSRIGVDNFGRVNANYYRGAMPDREDFAGLAALGIKTLIDLTSDDSEPREKAMAEGAGMTYLQIPMTTHEPPTVAKIEQFLGTVNDPGRQPVYVHCVGGRHRTGVMTAIYRMTQEGWTAEQAFKEMKQFKFGADFLHPEFKRFVYGYQVAAPAAASAASVESAPGKVQQ